uniref:IF rod domain-containing protein n=1 Tax=Sparus aurata TaxID=8175 RepID=A0A671U5M8_SPAAU
MRAASYTQKSLQVSGSSGRVRVSSPSPSRCRGSSYDSRGRSGYRGTAVEVGTEIHQQHANEKEEMQELNVKFAGYINKVQALEQRNAALQGQLDALQARYKGGPTGIGEEYELKFKEVRELIETLTNEKGAADIERVPNPPSLFPAKSTPALRPLSPFLSLPFATSAHFFATTAS